MIIMKTNNIQYTTWTNHPQLAQPLQQPRHASSHSSDFLTHIDPAPIKNLPSSVVLANSLNDSMVPTAIAVEPNNDLDIVNAAPHLSEVELSERLAKESSTQLRWTPGLGWMVNEGAYWERDEHRKRFNMVKLLCRKAASETNAPKLAAKLCSASNVSSILRLACSESSIATPIGEWDKYPMLLNTPGEVFDLETGLPVSRNGLLFTQLTSIAPTRMATPVWDRFINEVFDSDGDAIEFIQRLMGYCLTGSVKEQKLFFMHGAGANGKSVLLEVLHAIAGRYSHNLPSEALMRAKHERHPTTFAALKGKRVAISSEIEQSSRWAEARIKSLTGDATLTARYMRGDEFTFDVTHKHVLAGNFQPRFQGDDDAMVRRMVLVPFTQLFTGTRCDRNLPTKLKAEYPGILAWAIEGARKWAVDGLCIPSAVASATQEYRDRNDDIALWVKECCNVDIRFKAQSRILWANYFSWKLNNGEQPGCKEDFEERLKPKFRLSKSSVMTFFGLELKKR